MLSTNHDTVYTGSSFLWRFLRTFVISFVVTFVVLFGLNKVPQGLYETPHKIYVWVAAALSFDEVAFVAALPPSSDSVSEDNLSQGPGRTLSTSTSQSVSSEDRGVDWPYIEKQTNPAAPVRLSLPAVSINVPVITPKKTDVDSLDEALTKGVVLYPESGTPGGRNNLLFFGHSSHLPVVNNPAYKALNNLEYARLGDDIFIYTNNTRFHYRISAVRLTTAEEELISFDTSRRMITLSTCNTFGKKAERFVVEAIFVGSTPVTS